MTQPETEPVRPSEKQIGRIAAAAYIGTALEWYDFFLFGTTAALVFAPLFFPGDDPVLSTLSAFLSFAVGFVARPVGAVIFGHIGDRYGRRVALVATIALMGGATALIGVLPGYASAGVIAPVLLTILRAVQGAATGGEWGGATLLAIEYAAPERRGFYAAIVQQGSPTGTLLSTGAVALVSLLPRSEFLSWGWRLPYLASIVLVAVALWLRWRVEETPTFRALAARQEVERAPVLELFRRAPGRLVIGIAAYLVNNAGFFIITTFMISYATRVRELPSSVILNALTVGALGQMVGLVVSGKLADRYGSPRTVILGSVFSVVFAYPLFVVVDSGSTWLILVGYALTFGLGTIAYGPVGHLLSQLFPPRLHYSGLALSANLSGVIAGFMPALATWMLTRSGNASWGPASLYALIAVISLVGSIVAARIVRSSA
ncbi:MFS transporter [Pseudonocardia acaciae]|uniref:MFS transporter n=1 Tax=Pseudonocardia acaciae TaxID=551276 RepID=UPI00048E96DD|nr:MFS transporter [Pseudonocardia acaciae]